jgi:hypothetical protein
MATYKTKVLFDRFYSAKGLNEEPTIVWNCERELIDDTHLAIKKDQADYERIFKLPLAKARQSQNLKDLVLELEVGLEYTGTRLIKDPLSWTLSNNDHAIGIQLRDLTEYRNLGPYVGVEGTPGRRVLEYPANVGKNEEKATNQHWPRYFRITIKPLERVAYCRSPIDDGHLFTAEFDRNNPMVDLSSDLNLDVFRFDDAESYSINFVHVVLKIVVPKEAKP